MYDIITQERDTPLENISLAQVVENWNKAQKKKSTDSEGISAFLLHQLPQEYLRTITVAFNELAEKGDVLHMSKYAKVV